MRSAVARAMMPLAMNGFPAPEPSPLVGRDRELQAIDAALAELTDGRGGVLMVTGEPGIGKTRLLDALHARAASAGAAVLHGRTAAAQGDLPYDVVADAFADHRLEAADADLATAVAAITGAVPADRSGGDERFVRRTAPRPRMLAPPGPPRPRGALRAPPAAA